MLGPGTPYVLWGVVLLVVLVLGVQFVHKSTQMEDRPLRGETPRSAIGRWMPTAKAFVQGEDIYGYGHWFPNPPIVALAIAPLAYLPAWLMGLLWYLAKLKRLPIDEREFLSLIDQAESIPGELAGNP